MADPVIRILSPANNDKKLPNQSFDVRVNVTQFVIPPPKTLNIYVKVLNSNDSEVGTTKSYMVTPDQPQLLPCAGQAPASGEFPGQVIAYIENSSDSVEITEGP